MKILPFGGINQSITQAQSLTLFLQVCSWKPEDLILGDMWEWAKVRQTTSMDCLASKAFLLLIWFAV